MAANRVALRVQHLADLERTRRRVGPALANLADAQPGYPSGGDGGSAGGTSDRTGRLAATHLDRTARGLPGDPARQHLDDLRRRVIEIAEMERVHRADLDTVRSGERDPLRAEWTGRLVAAIVDLRNIVDLWCRTPAAAAHLRSTVPDRPGCEGCAMVETWTEPLPGGVLCERCARLVERVNEWFPRQRVKVPPVKLLDVAMFRRPSDNDIWRAVGRLPERAER